MDLISVLRSLDLVVLWRFGSQEMADEIVPFSTHEVRIVSKAVIAIGHDEQVKILVGFD